MGKSLSIKHTVTHQERNQKRMEGQGNVPQIHMDKICLGLRHVRLQIKKRDLRAYKRFSQLPTLSKNALICHSELQQGPSEPSMRVIRAQIAVSKGPKHLLSE